MGLILVLEASQPGGKTYRVGLGCFLPLGLVSVLVALFRLR